MNRAGEAMPRKNPRGWGKGFKFYEELLRTIAGFISWDASYVGEIVSSGKFLF